MTQEALKLALEALEGWCRGFPDLIGDLDEQAITAIKEALAQPEQTNIKRHEANVQKFLGAPQPEQEPVAWMDADGNVSDNNDHKCFPIPLYTTPPQRTEQEPVKIAHRHEWFRTGEMKVGQMRCISCGTWGQEDMTQRTWVGLTDEEVRQICVNEWGGYEQCRAIEAKLKEKNT